MTRSRVAVAWLFAGETVDFKGSGNIDIVRRVGLNAIIGDQIWPTLKDRQIPAPTARTHSNNEVASGLDEAGHAR